MASAVDSRLAYARLSAVATASRLPTATRGSNNSYTTSWDTTSAKPIAVALPPHSVRCCAEWSLALIAVFSERRWSVGRSTGMERATAGTSAGGPSVRGRRSRQCRGGPDYGPLRQSPGTITEHGPRALDLGFVVALIEHRGAPMFANGAQTLLRLLGRSKRGQRAPRQGIKLADAPAGNSVFGEMAHRGLRRSARRPMGFGQLWPETNLSAAFLPPRLKDIWPRRISRNRDSRIIYH